MSQPDGPYRAPGERPKLQAADRRWFTRQGSTEKGPYRASVLASSVKDGRLKETTLVRAEDGTEWRPLHQVDPIASILKEPFPGAGAAPSSRRRGAAPAPEGTLGGGFAAGFFGGIIGLIIVLWVSKGPATRRGAALGLLAQFIVGFFLQVVRLSSH